MFWRFMPGRVQRWRINRKYSQQREALLAPSTPRNERQKISSGVLTPGERQRIFRHRPKR